MSDEQKQEKPCKGKVVIIFLTILSLFFSIAALATSIYALNNGGGSEGKKVVISKQYDKGKSFEKAKATNKPIIVFFYTDWCHFCQKFVPTFDKMSKKREIKKNFAIAYVNCEKDENKKLTEEFEVHGFPTVYVIDAEGKKTQLENNTFFNDDSADIIAEDAMDLISKD